MAHPVIDTDECIGCGICVDTCAQEVLDIVDGVCEPVNEELASAAAPASKSAPWAPSSSKRTSPFPTPAKAQMKAAPRGGLFAWMMCRRRVRGNVNNNPGKR